MKWSFTLAHLMLLAGIAHALVYLVYGHLTGKTDMPHRAAAMAVYEKPATASGKKPSDRKDIASIILDRNLFNIQLHPIKESQKKDKMPEPAQTETVTLEPTKLSLKLWGTVTGTVVQYAVIEDTRTREQALYTAGDTVADAVIKEIVADRVILVVDGKSQVLEMDDQMPVKSEPVPDRKTHTAQNITVEKQLIDNSLENIQSVMQQVRIKPHFTDGQADGLLLYGIRPDSVFAIMGLENGDIVRQVNGTPTVVEEDAVKIYEDLEDANTARVVITRRGIRKELIYHVEHGAYSITQYPEQDDF